VIELRFAAKCLRRTRLAVGCGGTGERS